ncbi:MAG: hypothetical protein NZZ41_07400 [Candidatus Dojkabacteria bacterium]|nr:hypothetical protein [Candidatus Dojkabacteria bacterium]
MRIIVNPEKYNLLSEEGKKYFDRGFEKFCLFFSYAHEVEGITFYPAVDFYFEKESEITYDECLAYDRVKIRRGCFCMTQKLVRVSTQDNTDQKEEQKEKQQDAESDEKTEEILNSDTETTEETSEENLNSNSETTEAKEESVSTGRGRRKRS